MSEYLYDDIEKICKTFFENVHCGNCKHKESDVCYYCGKHSILYAASYDYLHTLTKEIIKIVKEHETDV